MSTIHRVMHKELKLSFKKLGNTDPKQIFPENKSNLSYWWKTLIWLLEGGFHLIFVDEFLINRNMMNTYGWARKGMPGRRLKKSTDLKMSFVVGHSEMGVEGIIGTKTTFNQAKYMKFLKELVLKAKEGQGVDQRKIVIVADNCMFHRMKQIQKFFKEKRISCAYSFPVQPRD